MILQTFPRSISKRPLLNRGSASALHRQYRVEIVSFVQSFVAGHFVNLHIPSQARPSEIPVMPNRRLLMPNMDLLASILACCCCSCE